jgi:hypothetical protein
MLDNPQVFRTLNERIAARERARLEIVCECAEEACTERVVITPVEFYEVRRHHGWYVVHPGHEWQGRVIERQSGFFVVEKPREETHYQR